MTDIDKRKANFTTNVLRQILASVTDESVEAGITLACSANTERATNPAWLETYRAAESSMEVVKIVRSMLVQYIATGQAGVVTLALRMHDVSTRDLVARARLAIVRASLTSLIQSEHDAALALDGKS
jgi:hypothetical protein